MPAAHQELTKLHDQRKVPCINDWYELSTSIKIFGDPSISRWTFSVMVFKGSSTCGAWMYVTNSNNQEKTSKPSHSKRRASSSTESP
jgi:hypothetical protein